MIRYTKLPENILQLLPGAVDYLKLHPNVLFAYLFGGLSKGTPRPLSDVDIALYLSQSSCAAEEKMEILGKLIYILQTDEIDLVILNTANLPLAMNILKYKKVIVDKEPFTRHRFESLTMRKYFDFSIKERSILRGRYLHGR